jgi:hypothetical protein
VGEGCALDIRLTNLGMGSGFLRLPPTTGTAPERLVLDDEVVIIVDGAMLYPLIQAVRPVLPLPTLLWELTVAADGRLSSNATAVDCHLQQATPSNVGM